MRRAGLLLAAALALGCSQQASAPPTRVPGSYDLALVGDLLFVNAASRDELRVIDLAHAGTSADPRDFIRGPNPIQPLAILVVRRPVALAKDVRWESGVEVAGPYVYARGEGSNEISVVGAARLALREERRLLASAPVTAIAARGPSPGRRSAGRAPAVARAAPHRLALRPGAAPAGKSCHPKSASPAPPCAGATDGAGQ